MELVVELSVSDETCSVAEVNLLLKESDRVLHSHCIDRTVSHHMSEIAVKTILIIYRMCRVHSYGSTDSALVCEAVA